MNDTKLETGTELPTNILDTGAVDVGELRKHLRTLATLEPSDAPMVSCYLSFDRGVLSRDTVGRHARLVRAGLPPHKQAAFDKAMARVYTQLEHRSERARGMAVFSRAGNSPHLQLLEFRVPVPELLFAEDTPVIYPLVELRDTFHRFVVVISNESSARILEVSLGAVVREVWTSAPAIPDDLRRQWSRDEYRNHRKDRVDRFLKVKLAVLERLVMSNGHTHLILAGNPRITARIRDRLPERLRAKLIDIVPMPPNADPGDVVQAAIASFIAQEQHESVVAASALCAEVDRGEMAELGTASSIEALRRGQADLLVMTDAYRPGQGWICSRCETLTAAPERLTGECPSCGGELVGVDLREHLVKLAERTACGFERVSHHEQLSAMGGVGCMLRYPRQHAT